MTRFALFFTLVLFADAANRKGSYGDGRDSRASKQARSRESKGSKLKRESKGSKLKEGRSITEERSAKLEKKQQHNEKQTRIKKVRSKRGRSDEVEDGSSNVTFSEGDPPFQFIRSASLPPRQTNEAGAGREPNRGKAASYDNASDVSTPSPPRGHRHMSTNTTPRLDVPPYDFTTAFCGPANHPVLLTTRTSSSSESSQTPSPKDILQGVQALENIIKSLEKSKSVDDPDAAAGLESPKNELPTQRQLKSPDIERVKLDLGQMSDVNDDGLHRVSTLELRESQDGTLTPRSLEVVQVWNAQRRDVVGSHLPMERLGTGLGRPKLTRSQSEGTGLGRNTSSHALGSTLGSINGNSEFESRTSHPTLSQHIQRGGTGTANPPPTEPNVGVPEQPRATQPNRPPPAVPNQPPPPEPGRHPVTVPAVRPPPVAEPAAERKVRFPNISYDASCGTEARKLDFLRECSAAVAPACCTAAQRGSTIVTIQGEVEAVQVAVESAREGRLVIGEYDTNGAALFEDPPGEPNQPPAEPHQRNQPPPEPAARNQQTTTETPPTRQDDSDSESSAVWPMSSKITLIAVGGFLIILAVAAALYWRSRAHVAETKTEPEIVIPRPQPEETRIHLPGFASKQESEAITHQDWKLLKKIGQGTYGSVFVAVNNRTGGLFAVKSVWLGRRAGNQEAQERLLENTVKEVEMLRNLGHPHIVKYLGSKWEPANPYFYIYLEYIPGGTLRDLMDHLKSAFPLGLTRNYTRQLLEGLHFLHTNSVVHRDLKPGNVLISTSGMLKLADFGTAYDLSKITHTVQQTICGTPAFIAPEVVRREKHTTVSDIWSLGVIVFEIGTGRLPYSWAGGHSILGAIATGKAAVNWPSLIDPTLHDFISSAMMRDPANRPCAETLLTHALLTNQDYDFTYPGATRMDKDSLNMEDRIKTYLKTLTDDLDEWLWTTTATEQKMLNTSMGSLNISPVVLSVQAERDRELKMARHNIFQVPAARVPDEYPADPNHRRNKELLHRSITASFGQRRRSSGDFAGEVLRQSLRARPDPPTRGEERRGVMDSIKIGELYGNSFSQIGDRKNEQGRDPREIGLVQGRSTLPTLWKDHLWSQASNTGDIDHARSNNRRKPSEGPPPASPGQRGIRGSVGSPTGGHATLYRAPRRDSTISALRLTLP